MKLIEITSSSDAVEWFEKHARIELYYGGSVTAEYYVKGVEEDADWTRSVSMILNGHGFELDMPISIPHVGWLKLKSFMITDFSRLPAVERELAIEDCDCSEGLLDYVKKAGSIRLSGVDIPMDAVMTLVSQHSTLVYMLSKRVADRHVRMTINSMEDDIELGIAVTKDGDSVNWEGLNFDDVFDLQEWLVENEYDSLFAVGW